ncbi:MAG: hydroxypyruvate isomerase family protein [Actinomycetales bacterium]
MSHSLRYAVNCSILFSELPLLERPAAVKAAGFDAVEFWWPFAEAVPSDGDVDAFVSAVQDAGVHLTGLNFFAGDMPGGDRGLVSWPGREREFLDNIDVVVAIAERLGTRAFNALYGNRVDHSTAEAQDELAIENLAAAAKAVGNLGGVVLVEPVSGAPRYPILTAAEALAVLDRTRRAGVDNVRLLCDLYHLATNGDAFENAVDAVRLIGHVQIADAPGRGEPGTGELDLDGDLSTLQAGGYAGYVGLEYKPTTTTEESLAWLPRERRASA